MTEPDAYLIQASLPWVITVISCFLGLISSILAIFFPAILKPSAIFVVTAAIGFVWMAYIGNEAWAVEIREIYK